MVLDELDAAAVFGFQEDRLDLCAGQSDAGLVIGVPAGLLGIAPRGSNPFHLDRLQPQQVAVKPAGAGHVTHGDGRYVNSGYKCHGSLGSD